VLLTKCGYCIPLHTWESWAGHGARSILHFSTSVWNKWAGFYFHLAGQMCLNQPAKSSCGTVARRSVHMRCREFERRVFAGARIRGWDASARRKP
jgi:hypothetical protein